ncbi:MAG: hypothetical protein QM579_01395 [Desulfovibrio sp.]|uniref:HNH endonuclease n=1 Tax=Desulfovibrio sp. TaxID=885 RepID=UPI0039E4666F
MAISVKTRKLLWARSGGRCAACSKKITASVGGNDLLAGNECHINSRKPFGPRYEAGRKDIDSYDNLIVLCSCCHDIVDKAVKYYTKERLIDMKKAHEARVCADIIPPSKSPYIDLLIRWEKAYKIDNWEDITYDFNIPGQNFIYQEFIDGVEEFEKLFNSVIRNKVYNCDVMNSALFTCIFYSKAFLETFFRHAERVGKKTFTVEKFYKPASLYGLSKKNDESEDLLIKYEDHCRLLYTIMIFMTAAVNNVITSAWDECDPWYRHNKGIVSLRSTECFFSSSYTESSEFSEMAKNKFLRGYRLSVDDLRRVIEDSLKE